MSGILGTGMLACGVLIGIAIGPVALGTSAADAARTIVALIGGPSAGPTPASATTGSTSTDSGGAGAGSLLSGPGSTPTTAAAAPAGASSASVTPAASSATTTSTTSTSSATTTMLAKLNAAGTVVADDFAAQSFDAVDAKHRLLEVHSATVPAVGTQVKFADRALANGTRSAARTVAVTGARPATITADGVVSFVNRANASYVLSDRGVSLPILTAATPAPKAASDPAAPPGSTPTTATTTTTTSTTTATSWSTTQTASAPTLQGVLSGLTSGLLPVAPTVPVSPTTPAGSAAAPLPSIGQRIEVIITLPLAGATGAAAGTLREVSHTTLGQTFGPFDLAGVISTIDKQKRVATISADGPGLGSDTIPVSVPPAIPLRRLTLPATVAAQVSAAAGAYTLSGLSLDDSASAAADKQKFLGDFRPRANARAARARKRSRSPQARARARGNGA